MKYNKLGLAILIFSILTNARSVFAEVTSARASDQSSNFVQFIPEGMCPGSETYQEDPSQGFRGIYEGAKISLKYSCIPNQKFPEEFKITVSDAPEWLSLFRIGMIFDCKKPGFGGGDITCKLTNKESFGPIPNVTDGRCLGRYQDVCETYFEIKKIGRRGQVNPSMTVDVLECPLRAKPGSTLKECFFMEDRRNFYRNLRGESVGCRAEKEGDRKFNIGDSVYMLRDEKTESLFTLEKCKNGSRDLSFAATNGNGIRSFFNQRNIYLSGEQKKAITEVFKITPIRDTAIMWGYEKFGGGTSGLTGNSFPAEARLIAVNLKDKSEASASLLNPSSVQEIKILRVSEDGTNICIEVVSNSHQRTRYKFYSDGHLETLD